VVAVVLAAGDPPATAAVLIITTRSAPWSRAASSTLAVPMIFTWMAP
jgi:hypothetical protein